MGVTPSSRPCVALVSSVGEGWKRQSYVKQQKSGAGLVQDARLEEGELLLAVLLELLWVRVAVLLGPGGGEPVNLRLVFVVAEWATWDAHKNGYSWSSTLLNHSGSMK